MKLPKLTIRQMMGLVGLCAVVIWGTWFILQEERDRYFWFGKYYKEIAANERRIVANYEKLVAEKKIDKNAPSNQDFADYHRQRITRYDQTQAYLSDLADHPWRRLAPGSLGPETYSANVDISRFIAFWNLQPAKEPVKSEQK